MTKPKVLIAAIHWPVASGRYMSSAFRRIGCDVKTVGPEAYDNIWGMRVNPKYIWKPDIGVGTDILDARIQYVLAMLHGWQPDLIVTMDSAFDVIGERSEFPCPKVLYGVDNHVRDYARNRYSWFDKMFLAHHDGPALKVAGEKAGMLWLPCAYDDLAFTPSPIPMAEREYDVALIGFPYARRNAIVEAMLKAGLRVRYELGPLYEAFAAAYHDARISLCVSAHEDLAQRIFETSALGCTLLTDSLPDLRRLGAVEGKHYVEYSDTADAVNKALDLLKYPARLQDIASAGQAFFAPHTWTKRAYTILEEMGL